MKDLISSVINKNINMVKVVLISLGNISILNFGDTLRHSDNVYAINLGYGVSLIGVIFTGYFVYKVTPVMVKEFKLRWNTR